MKHSSYILLVLLLVLFAGSSATATYFYRQLYSVEQELTELRNNPQKIAQDEVKELVKRVSELIVLPEGEQPTVATVTDPELLKDQAFFAQAKKGYKVLIFTNAKKAILYDPVSHKIIDVAPVNIGNQSESGGSSSK